MLNQKNAGISLVEMMVVLSLSSLLLMSVIQIFLRQSVQLKEQQALNGLMNNGNVALNFLARDIRQAGSFGCVDVARQLKNMTVLRGFPVKNAEEGQHAVLSLVEAQSSPLALVQNMQSKNQMVLFSSKPLKANSEFVISNCKNAEVFKASKILKLNAQHYLIRINRSLSRLYTRSAMVNQLQSINYFVGKTGRKDSQSKPIYALYRMDQSNHREEIVDGVEALVFKYGYFGKGSKRLVTVSAGAIQNWSTVKLVHIKLLLVSEASVSAIDDDYYFFNGQEIKATDRRLHVALEMSVAIRNRVYDDAK